VRLNVVLTKGFNDSADDIKRILDFADFSGCSVKFIELANNKDKVVTMDELQKILQDFGFKERARDERKIIMSDNVVLTRTACEDAKLTDNTVGLCRRNMDFFVTPSGHINHCINKNTINEDSSILAEVKSRDEENLVTKLKMIESRFGQDCMYKNKNDKTT